MALTTYRIGDLVSVVDERNNLGLRNFSGINIHKEFMPTVADIEGLDETKYKVVRRNRFVYSGMQTGRDMCIRISMYNGDDPIIVSPAYITFEITKTDIVLPLYFFIVFLSKEKDRYGAFCSDGSIRSNLDWNVFCDISLELPSLDIQKKYVAIYNSLLENQKSYERGLEDLKLVCDAYIEDLRRKYPSKRIGEFIEIVDNRNNALKYGITEVKGISTGKEFIETKANMDGVGLTSYKIVNPNEFAYVPDTSRRGEKIAIAYNSFDTSILVSSIYTVFRVCESDKLNSKYLFLFFNRSEFDRYSRFNSWGSARETFDWNDMQDVCIPIPDINIQKSIAEIADAYSHRISINEKLKQQIKDICPILIKGSIDEGRKF